MKLRVDVGKATFDLYAFHTFGLKSDFGSTRNKKRQDITNHI